MAKKTTKSATAKAETKKKVTRKKAAADGAEPTKVKKKAKRKTRVKKEVIPDRFKLCWGVFNHAMKRVALFEFNQKKAAEKRAAELSEGGKPPHFVQRVKELIEPEIEVVEQAEK